MTEHVGRRSCYVGGCRMPQCVDANTMYQRTRRDRRRGLVDDADGAASVVTLVPPSDSPVEIGLVEAATVAELDSMTSPDRYPGQAAACIALAKILDQPKLASTHPSAQRQLVAGLKTLWAKNETKVGRLADVTKMTRGAR